MELAPDGAGYRLNTRFARFINVPELMQMFRQVADVKTPTMLKLPVPNWRRQADDRQRARNARIEEVCAKHSSNAPRRSNAGGLTRARTTCSSDDRRAQSGAGSAA